MTSSLPSGTPSKALDGLSVNLPKSTAERFVNAAHMLLGRFPESKQDFKTLGARLAKVIKRRKPYNGYYIESIWKGYNSMSKPISKAVDNLISELTAEPPPTHYRTTTVQVPNSFNVPYGTIVQRDARTCICGVSFIPTAWNQINHTPACARMRARMKKRSRN